MWSVNHGLEWAWSPQELGPAAPYLLLTAALPLCGISSSAFFLLAHALYISIPESRRNLSDDLSICHCSYGMSPASGFAGHPMNGHPLDWGLLPPPICTSTHTAPSQKLLQPKGKFPCLFCSASSAVLGLMMFASGCLNGMQIVRPWQEGSGSAFELELAKQNHTKWHTFFAELLRQG